MTFAELISSTSWAELKAALVWPGISGWHAQMVAQTSHDATAPP